MTNKELAEVLNIPETEIEHIDPEIRDLLYILNTKGYRTVGSCQGHVEKATQDCRANICIVFDRRYGNEYNFPIAPPTLERKGNKAYGGLHQPKRYGHINQALYYSTSRCTSDEQKEKERKEILNMIYDWAKEL